MNCIFCQQLTNEQRNFAYSYDVRGTTFWKWFEKPCCKPCWDKHWKEATKFWDWVDEVMNRNKHFIREKGMIGKYKDWIEYWPVYAYWKRADIEWNFLFEPLGEEKEHLHKFRDWLQINNLTYKYDPR